VLGTISWRGPFFGVSVLMTVALLVTVFLLPSTVTRSQPTSLGEPFTPSSIGDCWASR
jgi:predicted MFS family arabinose efflux permease